MVTVCAWCQKFLATKDPTGFLAVTHGICPTCASRQRIGEMPTLVITRKWEHTLPLMTALLRGTPEIRVVVDRRVTRRRKRPAECPPEERRQSKDRRRGEGMRVV